MHYLLSNLHAVPQAGFFRFAAYNMNDAESWHNYAACRQLVYGDLCAASEYYLKAIQINPKDVNIQVRLPQCRATSKALGQKLDDVQVGSGA